MYFPRHALVWISLVVQQGRSFIEGILTILTARELLFRSDESDLVKECCDIHGLDVVPSSSDANRYTWEYAPSDGFAKLSG